MIATAGTTESKGAGDGGIGDRQRAPVGNSAAVSVHDDVGSPSIGNRQAGDGGANTGGDVEDAELR